MGKVTVNKERSSVTPARATNVSKTYENTETNGQVAFRQVFRVIVVAIGEMWIACIEGPYCSWFGGVCAGLFKLRQWGCADNWGTVSRTAGR